MSPARSPALCLPGTPASAAAVGTIWCAGAVLALNLLTERFPGGRAPAPHRRAKFGVEIPDDEQKDLATVQDVVTYVPDRAP